MKSCKVTLPTLYMVQHASLSKGLCTRKRTVLWAVFFLQVIRHSLVIAQKTDVHLTKALHKLTPSSDEDHDEHESSSTFQGPHVAYSQDCWQESKTKVC